MKPHREIATLRHLKLYHKQNLVSGMAKMDEKVYLHGLFERKPELRITERFGLEATLKIILSCLSPVSG